MNGIFDMTNEEYHADRTHISRSGIMQLLKSPRHFKKYYIDNELKQEQTDAMIFGEAFHCFLLEPLSFKDRYYITPPCDRRTKEGKAIWSQALDRGAGKILITQDDFDSLCGMIDSFNECDYAHDLLIESQNELSLFWEDKNTGVSLKARPDAICGKAYIEIKTTNDACERAFLYDVYKYGYHIQAAMVLDGGNIIDPESLDTAINIAVEKKPPYAIGIYILDHDLVEEGRQEYKTASSLYKNCINGLFGNNWPSYEPKILRSRNAR